MRRADRLVTAAVTGVAVVGLLIGGLGRGGATYDLSPLAVALVLTQGLVLLRRRANPVAVLAASTLAVLGLGLLHHPSTGGALGPLAATYAVGAYARSRWAPAALLPVVFSLAAVGANVSVSSGRTGPDPVARLVSGAALYGAFLLAGRLARSRREAAVERTRAAVAEERVRIARELHDVVAHHIGVMSLHAGAGRRLIDADPAAARQAFAQIEASGREALAAMPQLVGELRDGGTAAGPVAPQPRLADLERLVAEMGSAGLPVRLAVHGDRRPLASSVELSSYRIIQEALTNAIRHAGPASVDVVVAYGAEELRIEVLDDGRGHGRSGAAADVGFGLTGIRERVASLGGSCDIGPRPAGGFAVRATLPLARAAVG